ncbi:MAG: amino acid ABC transporter permease [Ruminococcus sp.]|nr:amino acid ABC transporter permease [Ruminococcus sp.]
MSFLEVTQWLLEGFSTTLLLFAFTLILSLPLGLVLMFGTTTKFWPVKILTRAFVYIIRGTPLMLQLMVVYYIPGIVFHYSVLKWPIFGGNVPLAQFCCALFTFVMNYACYFSEIYRGGIQSIPKGQYEAGQVLGMTKSQVFFKVILLQVVKNILAPVSNETITLVKDTALANIIAVTEIIFFAERALNLHNIIWPMFYTGVFYLGFNALLTFIFNRLERKLSYIRS